MRQHADLTTVSVLGCVMVQVLDVDLEDEHESGQHYEVTSR